MRPYTDYIEQHERGPSRTYECKDCRLPMSHKNYFRTSGYCATCRDERAYEPPPEIVYEVGLCQTKWTDTWPFFAPDDERKGSIQMRQRIALAKDICALCPCREACKDWALKQGRNLYGIWGGTTRGERKRIRAAQ